MSEDTTTCPTCGKAYPSSGLPGFGGMCPFCMLGTLVDKDGGDGIPDLAGTQIGRYTLVEEERIVPLLASNNTRGNNRIDFSWSNTQIDKDSIQFRPLAIREDGKFRRSRRARSR